MSLNGLGARDQACATFAKVGIDYPAASNAVRHGVEPAADGGTIRVRTRLRRGHAVITIDNSLPPHASRPGAGMALRNVRERLHLMHDVAASFDAQPDGTLYRVRIVVPV